MPSLASRMTVGELAPYQTNRVLFGYEMIEQTHLQPKLFVPESVNRSLHIDVLPIVQTLQDRGTSPEGITSTSVVFDAKDRFSYRGSQTPKLIDRLLHGKSEANEGRGSVIRVGTQFRGRERTPVEINQTLDHELEHVAQADRGDVAPVIGNLAIWGGLIGGAIVANRAITKRTTRLAPRIAATVIGGLIGNRVGYQLAPHERQARSAAQAHDTPAVTKK